MQGAVVLAALFCISLRGGRQAALPTLCCSPGGWLTAGGGVCFVGSAVGKRRLPVVSPFLLEVAAWPLFS